ncbi:E3 ubiquitin-protein ligase NRDP1-like [Apostichopus japonicus]|uniref:E3 ubiquitin-protein ligase NRDP1-like n=1 Tax=Stichopus japonicus TaxID=307972 RepID=UPI003AB2F7D2
MGWLIERFPSKPDQDLLCGICKGVYQDAVATSCGHTFCAVCIQTWLDRACRKTCPQCRKTLTGCEVIPIFSLRQVVNKICIYCENRPRGCTFISRLEDVKTHTTHCGYAAKKCDECGDTLNRRDFVEHRDFCHGRNINRSIIGYTAEDIHQKNGILEKKMGILEIQLKHTRKKLELCDADNRKLKRELSTAKAEIQSLSREISFNEITAPILNLTKPVSVDDVSPDTISELSLLITSSLRVKPVHVNVDRIFLLIKRHYEKYARCGTCYEYDVHMMIATAYASNWFTGEQRVLLHHWLESIARYRKYVNMRTSIANVQLGPVRNTSSV